MNKSNAAEIVKAIMRSMGANEPGSIVADDSDGIPKPPKCRRVTEQDKRAKEKRIAKRRARKGYR